MTDSDPTADSNPARLQVAGKQFCVDGKSHFIRAVTYGPFAEPVDDEKELARISDEQGANANAIRVYEIPSNEFMDLAAKAGLRVFIGIPWTQHVDFFHEEEALKAAHELVQETATKFRGHPAVAGYLVANEIHSPLVRWMGPGRVERALESLIETGKMADPDALFSYANYPTTEYLLPANQDFVSFNIYLNSADAFGDYLYRLQNLAGDKPLFLAEFGVDTRAEGEEKQVEVLGWHLDKVCAAGLAGTTIFAWSDNWKRGGKAIEDWDFGLTRRDTTARPALSSLSAKWGDLESPADGIELVNPPKISVIVCTHRGSATLNQCLESLEAQRYPNCEVVVVNDGSDSAVTEIAETFPDFKLLNIEHGGLSRARNTGAQHAEGEIFAYTDDDCVAPPDWLTWLAFGYRELPGVSCLGGPNIPPPPQNFQQACVAVSPGGPAHVLLTDRIAEHVPGCNLSVRREAFEAIGGFNPVFWTAGDDVDFCWRLTDAGHEIGFHPAAFVWHFRRFNFKGYFKQQSGYGKAEAMLVPLHPNRFGDVGGARWYGAIYEPARQSSLSGFSRIYQGIFGYEPYQMIYGGGTSVFGYLVGTVQWVISGLLLLLIGAIGWNPPGDEELQTLDLFFGIVGVAGLTFISTSVIYALRAGLGAPVLTGYSRFKSKVCLSFLAFAQPLVRSYRRFTGSLRYSRIPTNLSGSIGPLFLPQFRLLTRWRHYRFWSEKGITRDDLLNEILYGRERQATIPVRPGTGWEDWDIDLPVSHLWTLHLRTVTEYHANEDRLTRCKLESRPTLLTVAWRTAALLWVILSWNSDASTVRTVAAWLALLLPEFFLIRGFMRGSKCLRQAANACGLEQADQ